MILIDVPFDKKMFHTTNRFQNYHKYKKHSIKHEYLWWIKTIKINKPEDIDYPVKLHFLFTFGKGNRVYDSSNCAAMGKMIEDCLVTKGILEDDRAKFVESVTYESKRGPSNHLTVSIL